jgi:hypothetical protein
MVQQPSIGRWPAFLQVLRHDVLRREVISPLPNPNFKDQVSVFVAPQKQGGRAIPLDIG